MHTYLDRPSPSKVTLWLSVRPRRAPTPRRDNDALDGTLCVGRARTALRWAGSRECGAGADCAIRCDTTPTSRGRCRDRQGRTEQKEKRRKRPWPPGRCCCPWPVCAKAKPLEAATKVHRRHLGSEHAPHAHAAPPRRAMRGPTCACPWTGSLACKALQIRRKVRGLLTLSSLCAFLSSGHAVLAPRQLARGARGLCVQYPRCRDGRRRPGGWI